MAIRAALLCAALLALPACSATPPPAASPPTSVQTSAPTPQSVTRQASRADPTILRLPTLGLSSRIDPVGTDDRVLRIPEDPRVVGWWRDGARPGDRDGTIVLTAHLDGRKYGTGPFEEVTDLYAGDPMTLQDSAGDTHRYVVTRVDN